MLCDKVELSSEQNGVYQMRNMHHQSSMPRPLFWRFCPRTLMDRRSREVAVLFSQVGNREKKPRELRGQASNDKLPACLARQVLDRLVVRAARVLQTSKAFSGRGDPYDKKPAPPVLDGPDAGNVRAVCR